MKREENFANNYHNQNKISNGTKLTSIILFVLLIAVVSIFSKKSYASETDKTINASLLNGSFNLLSENSNDMMMSEINESVQDTTGLLKGTRKLNFYEDENGNLVHYKAKILDGKLTDLYINGEKVPADELLKYENKIQKKIDEYESALQEYRNNKKEYKMLTKEYAGKMKEQQEKLREFRNDQFDFDFDFDFDIQKPDLTELREAMRELRHELKDSFADRSIVIPPVHIPRINIPPIHVPPVNFDKNELDKWNDELNENLEELKEEMKNNKLNMREFNENMKEFRGKMKEFGLEMKKFGSFVKEMKRELIEDGIINSGDDIDELLLSEDKMEVNDKTVSADLHKKYKNMYEKHTGKKIDGKNKIRIKD